MAWSLLLFTRLFPPEPKSSHTYGPCSLEQHGTGHCLLMNINSWWFCWKWLTFSQLEPVGNKTYTQDFTSGVDLKCPSEVGFDSTTYLNWSYAISNAFPKFTILFQTVPFIRTASNSNYTFKGPLPTPPPITVGTVYYSTSNLTAQLLMRCYCLLQSNNPRVRSTQVRFHYRTINEINFTLINFTYCLNLSGTLLCKLLWYRQKPRRSKTMTQMSMFTALTSFLKWIKHQFSPNT